MPGVGCILGHSNIPPRPGSGNTWHMKNYMVVQGLVGGGGGGYMWTPLGQCQCLSGWYTNHPYPVEHSTLMLANFTLLSDG